VWKDRHRPRDRGDSSIHFTINYGPKVRVDIASANGHPLTVDNDWSTKSPQAVLQLSQTMGCTLDVVGVRKEEFQQLRLVNCLTICRRQKECKREQLR
jgi:hypothetical protein